MSANPTDNTLLLVTHSMDEQLRLYRISIDFSQLVFNVQHIETVHDCSSLEVDSARITHLELVPPGPETRNREPTSPFILAAFSRVPDQFHDTQIQEEPVSLLARWELGVLKPMLHPTFAQLVSKKSNIAPIVDLPVWVFHCLKFDERLTRVSVRSLP
jgi:hypothetical protein